MASSHLGEPFRMSLSNRTGLLVLQGNRLELLAEAVSAWLAANPLAPLEQETILVQSNGMAESFVKTLKRDYAKLADRADSQTVMAQLPKWFDDYNSYHPHSVLGYVPAKLFREKRAVN